MVDHLVNGVCKHYSFEQLWCIWTVYQLILLILVILPFLSITSHSFSLFIRYFSFDVKEISKMSDVNVIQKCLLCKLVTTLCLFSYHMLFSKWWILIKSLFYNTMTSFLKHYSILLKPPGVKLGQNSLFCRENFCNDF